MQKKCRSLQNVIHTQRIGYDLENQIGEKYMRNLKLFLIAALVATSTASIQANYTISVTTSPAVNTTAGASGQSYFDFTFSGGGQFTYQSRSLWAVDPVDPGQPLFGAGVNPFSALTVDSSSTLLFGAGQHYNSGSTYRLVVNWTVDPTWVAGGQYGIYFNLFANQPDAVRANAGATDIINIAAAAVPEPGQMLGASMILGFGALAFTGRRWVKRKGR